MKRKIYIQIAIIIVMISTALALFENSYAIAKALDIDHWLIDSAALLSMSAMLFPCGNLKRLNK